LGEVKTLDPVPRHIDRQYFARTVEHGAWQRCTARALDAFTLVDSNFEQVTNEPFVSIGAHESQCIATLRRLDSSPAFTRPVSDVAPWVGDRAERDNAVLRKDALDLIVY
jgi:hypothetical protein